MINAFFHTVNTTKNKMQHMSWEIVEHLVTLVGTKGMPVLVECSSETSCSQLFQQQPSEFFKKGIKHLVTQMDTCLNVGSKFKSVE
jgi:hypothetical protein